MRKPRSLTWPSARPRYSSSPDSSQTARSPVRYIRPPGSPNGSGTNRPAVSSGRPAYPRASPSPARYSSPAIPAGAGWRLASSTYARVFASGRPIVTRSAPRGTTAPVEYVVSSVGP